MGKSELKGLFYPRTKRDFEQIIEWIALGKSESELLGLFQHEDWRTELVEFRAELFCGNCDAMISPDWCSFCGEPDWRDA
jgi:hypothetical protein